MALEKVKSSGFPFSTRPTQQTINVAQPLTLGRAFDVEKWLKSFTVLVIEEDRWGNRHLLSAQDKVYLRLMRDRTLLGLLDNLTSAQSTNPSNRDKVLIDLLAGYPVESTISTLLKK